MFQLTSFTLTVFDVLSYSCDWTHVKLSQRLWLPSYIYDTSCLRT